MTKEKLARLQTLVKKFPQLDWDFVHEGKSAGNPLVTRSYALAANEVAEALSELIGEIAYLWDENKALSRDIVKLEDEVRAVHKANTQYEAHSCEDAGHAQRIHRVLHEGYEEDCTKGLCADVAPDHTTKKDKMPPGAEVHLEVRWPDGCREARDGILAERSMAAAWYPRSVFSVFIKAFIEDYMYQSEHLGGCLLGQMRVSLLENRQE